MSGFRAQDLDCGRLRNGMPAAHLAGRERSREAAILQCVLVGLLALSSLALLFLLRGLDDNRLVSWQWVFAPADLFVLVATLAAGLLVAYWLARVPWPGDRAALTLGTCAFFAAMPFWAAPEVIVDAARYFVQAKHLSLFGVGHFLSEWGREIPAWTDLPLVPLLYGLLFSVAGEARIAIQVLNSLLFAGTVVLTYILGKTLWDRTTGLCAALLLLGTPYLLTQVSLMLVDVPAMFFLALAAYAALAGVTRGGALWLIGAGVALALALLAKYSAWVALGFFPVLVLASAGHERRLALARASVIVLGAAALVGAFLLAKAEVVAGQLALFWSYQVPALGGWQESAASTFLFQIHPFVTLAALGAVVLAVIKKDSRSAGIGLIVLVVLLLGVGRIRYLVILMPMLALMAACGLRAIREIPTRQFIAASAAVSALVVALAGYLPFLRTTSAVNLQQAGALLDAMQGDTVEVIVLPPTRSSVNPAVAVPLLDLYTRKRLVYRRDLSPALSPPPGAVAISPVRFTWEFPDAPFFLAPPEPQMPVVVVMSAADQPAPEAAASRLADYAEARRLVLIDRVFRYQTLVRIYRPT